MSSVFLEHHVRPNVREISPFETATREAFGDEKYAKIKIQLEVNEDEQVRLSNLQLLSDALHQPTAVVRAVRAGIIPILTLLLDNSSQEIQQQTAFALSMIACVRSGREELMAQGTLEKAIIMLSDENDGVCSNVLRLFRRFAATCEGAAGLIKGKFVSSLIDHMLGFKPEQRVIALNILHNIILSEKGLTNAHESGAVPILTNVLKDTNDPCGFREKAAENLALLTLCAEGQHSALSSGAVGILIDVLKDDLPAAARRSSGAALVGCTVLQEAKQEAVDIGAINTLISLLDDEDDEILAKVIQAITNIAELPSGRRALYPALPLLRSHLKNKILADVAKGALTQLDRPL